MQNKITAWSFSRYGDYKQCPYKAYLKHVKKIKEPTNKYMERGSKIHDMAENYIKSNIPAKMPDELKQFPEVFKALRKQYKKKMNCMVVEDTWAFDKDWNETQWNNWKECWVRIKLDCAYHEDDITLNIIDWKTGKFRDDSVEDYIEQLELYALAALLLHDHIEVVRPSLYYLDYGIIYPEGNWASFEQGLTFFRKDITKLKALWAKRVEPMLTDTKFAPKANKFCNWCHFRKDNKLNGGGQCEY